MFSIFGPDYIIAAPVSLTLFNNDTTLIDGVILCNYPSHVHGIHKKKNLGVHVYSYLFMDYGAWGHPYSI